jgi:phosphoglycolate phosphatase
MLQKYKHISFDLDGTLVHTLPKYRQKVVSLVIEHLGGKILNLHSIDKFWFEADRNKIIRNEFDLDPKLFWDLFSKKDLTEKRSAHTFAYPDAEPALRKLKDMDKKISIITGAPHRIAQMEIKKLNGAPHDYYLSLDKKFNEKPDPTGFWHVLKKINCQPSETVYIGNSNEDALFAENAGVDFIYLERKEHQFYLGKNSIARIHGLNKLF